MVVDRREEIEQFFAAYAKRSDDALHEPPVEDVEGGVEGGKNSVMVDAVDAVEEVMADVELVFQPWWWWWSTSKLEETCAGESSNNESLVDGGETSTTSRVGSSSASSDDDKSMDRLGILGSTSFSSRSCTWFG